MTDFDTDANPARWQRLLGTRAATVPFVRGSLLDRPLLYQTFVQHGITRVIHLAALQVPFRCPAFNEPDASYHGLVYAQRFGEKAFIERARSVYQRTTGSVLSPMSAFLLLQQGIQHQ